MQRPYYTVDFDLYAPCECGRMKLDIYRDLDASPPVYQLWCPNCETLRKQEYSVRLVLLFHVQDYLRDHTCNSEPAIEAAARRITNFLEAFNLHEPHTMMY